MKIIPILILTLFLQSCGWLSRKPEVPAITTQTVQIDSKALEQCPLIEDNPADLTSFEGIRTAHTLLQIEYGKCAIRQAGSIKIIKKFGSIE